MKNPQIIIHRPNEYVGKLRKLWIFIDGEKTAYVKNGKTVSLEVNSGKHEIFVSMDYLISNKLEVPVDPQETVLLECGSTLRGVKFYFSLFVILAAYLFRSIKVFYIKRAQNSK